jgi:hypothetical protein
VDERIDEETKSGRRSDDETSEIRSDETNDRSDEKEGSAGRRSDGGDRS